MIELDFPNCFEFVIQTRHEYETLKKDYIMKRMSDHTTNKTPTRYAAIQETFPMKKD